MTRQQRRAAERESLRYFERAGIPPTRDIVPLILQTKKLIGVLSNQGNPRRASDVAELALKGFEISATNHPPEKSLDCRAGCSFCCHLWVAATAPEVLLIARSILQQSPAARDLSRHRIEQAYHATAGKNEDERQMDPKPCALLDQSRCTVYSSRPLVCRAMVSHDVTACESAFRDGGASIPVPANMPLLRRAHRYCLTAALRRHGLSTKVHELNHAIWKALNVERVEERWLAGEDVFAGVDSRDEAGAQIEFLDTLIAGAGFAVPQPKKG